MKTWHLLLLGSVLTFTSLPSAADLVPVPDFGLRIERGFSISEFAGNDLAPDVYCMTLDSAGRVVLLLVPFGDVPGVLPTPCLLLTPPPTLVPVVPCMPVVGADEPVAVAPPVDPAELSDAPAPPEAPPLWASARDELKAKAAVRNSVASFIGCPSER